MLLIQAVLIKYLVEQNLCLNPLTIDDDVVGGELGRNWTGCAWEVCRWGSLKQCLVDTMLGC